MRHDLMILAIALGIAGCSTISDVQPYGQDTYVIYTKVRNVAAGQEQAVTKANAYCSQSGRSMRPIEHKKIARRQFEFTFKCG
jgi:hypothetical protein